MGVDMPAAEGVGGCASAVSEYVIGLGWSGEKRARVYGRRGCFCDNDCEVVVVGC
jgi:hypothetical protein